MTEPVSHEELATLARFDTPTICNALELVAPERRALGFNRRPLLCPLAGAKPVVGYARTVTIRFCNRSPAVKRLLFRTQPPIFPHAASYHAASYIVAAQGWQTRWTASTSLKRRLFAVLRRTILTFASTYSNWSCIVT